MNSYRGTALYGEKLKGRRAGEDRLLLYSKEPAKCQKRCIINIPSKNNLLKIIRKAFTEAVSSVHISPIVPFFLD